MQPNQQYPPQGYPQQYAPQPYPQQAPQGYAPQAQYAPQPYPQQMQQQAPAPQPGWGGANPNPDEFAAPDAVGGIRPRLKDAGVGRLVLISPMKIERNVPNQLAKPDENGKLPTQDRMTADVVFLDGPPFMYGGDPDGDNGQPKPHTMQATMPHEARSMWLSNVLLIQQCERSIGGGMVLGRLIKGIPSRPGNRPPWKLDDPTEADKQVARDYLVAKQAGRIAPPVQVAPQQAPASVQQYAPQPQYQPQPDAQQQAAQYLAGPPQAQYAPAPPAPAAIDTNTPPPGWAPEVWATIPDEQRQMIAAATAARPGI